MNLAKPLVTLNFHNLELFIKINKLFKKKKRIGPKLLSQKAKTGSFALKQMDLHENETI